MTLKLIGIIPQKRTINLKKIIILKLSVLSLKKETTKDNTIIITNKTLFSKLISLSKAPTLNFALFEFNFAFVSFPEYITTVIRSSVART